MTKKTKIAPSILAADFARLGEEVRAITEAGADYIHVDVMDGHFVPNLTIGPPVIRAVRRVAQVPLDVHLMVQRPEQYIAEYADLGVSVFTFHPEATIHVQRQLAAIRERGMQAGLALNPGTPLALLEEVVADVDLVLVMSVNPGFAGQAFIPQSLAKIAALRGLIDRSGREVRLEVDGGIKIDNIAAVAAAGADTFVAGSAIFGSADYAATVRAMRAAVAAAG